MITDYDQIAEQYQRAKLQPWRTFIEAFTLMPLTGDLTGKSVLDMACGEGFYSRLLKRSGAARVTGVDLSQGMITLARQQEASQPLGIDYVVADAAHYRPTDRFDLVFAAYLLNYARNRQELRKLCDAIARCLKPGGRFVSVNCSPTLRFPSAPSYLKYGFETQVPGVWGEGAPIVWRFHLEDGVFEIENYHLDSSIHEEAFRLAGLQQVRWYPPQLASGGRDLHGSAFWADFLRHSPVTFIECSF